MRAWFVVISLGLALSAAVACGDDDDADLSGACEKLCSCDPEAEDTCVSQCEVEAAEENPSEACVACVKSTACAEIFTGCNDECNFTGAKPLAGR